MLNADFYLNGDHLDHFAWSVIQLAFVAGIVGAFAWQTFWALLGWLSDQLTSWEDRRARIHAARIRAANRHTGEV
ncbi:MAG: hypothetical protein J7556_13520 [Acidovorax sp.]|nr:hypothetical protein [Acidovorax sp.]